MLSRLLVITPTFATTKNQILGFLILYVVTFIPCWVVLYFCLKSFALKKFVPFVIWFIFLMFLFALPYLFVLISLNHVPIQLWIATLLIFLFSSYKLLFSSGKLSTNTFWDWYAKSYDVLLTFGPYKELITTLAKDILAEKKELIEILDVGCGTGNLIPELLSHNVNYLGIDSSTTMLNRARSKTDNHSNFKLLLLDLSGNLNRITQKFDVIVINNVLYTLEHHQNLLKELVEKIQPQGKILISEPLRDSSLLKLYLDYFKKSKFQALKTLLFHFAPYLSILIANIIIIHLSEVKQKNFFDSAELQKNISENRLKILSTQTVYAGQNIYITASPIN